MGNLCLNFLTLLLITATSITDGKERSQGREDVSNLASVQSSTMSVFTIEVMKPGIGVAHQVASPGKVSATEPYIDSATPLLVTAYVGRPAIIQCLVNNLGLRSVSWVRHEDIHVLSVGRFTFTNDDRFEVQHDDGSNEWVLKLSAPAVNDSGTYECQINTKPTISQLITLQVFEPKAIITPGTDIYLDRGSTLKLTCQVIDAPSTPEFILWYHQGKVANYEVDHVEVSVKTINGTTVSMLTLADAQTPNSGTYTCSPSNATPASVMVHVLSGEHPAAMQTNSASSSSTSISSSSSSYCSTSIFTSFLHRKERPKHILQCGPKSSWTAIALIAHICIAVVARESWNSAFHNSLAHMIMLSVVSIMFCGPLYQVSLASS